MLLLLLFFFFFLFLLLLLLLQLHFWLLRLLLLLNFDTPNTKCPGNETSCNYLESLVTGVRPLKGRVIQQVQDEYSQQNHQNAVDTLSVQALVSEKDESAQYPKETRGQNKNN